MLNLPRVSATIALILCLAGYVRCAAAATLRATPPHGDNVADVAYAPDGCTLARGAGNMVRLWRL